MMMAMQPTPPSAVDTSNSSALDVQNPNFDFGHIIDNHLKKLTALAPAVGNPNFNFGKISDNDLINSVDEEKLTKNMKKMSISKRMKMVSGSCYLPKHKPGDPDFQGQDAHFIYDGGQTIGVADGVGGWMKKGIDSGVYARQLMSHAKNEAVGQIAGGAAAVDPGTALDEAFEKNGGIQGSSTACILSFDADNGDLWVVNVGDSGFMVFRDNELLLKSEIQQNSFNQPYQLGNHPSSDTPKYADEYKVERLRQGDIIVLGTDGLLDNMFPNEVEEILGDWSDKNKCKDKKWCEDLAVFIADRACYNSNSEDYVSPFAIEAKNVGLEYRGGKIDDITVIVAILAATTS